TEAVARGRSMIGGALILALRQTQLSRWNTPKCKKSTMPAIPAQHAGVVTVVNCAAHKITTAPMAGFNQALCQARRAGLGISGRSTRKVFASIPGHASKYVKCRAAEAPLVPALHHVSHLHPTKITRAIIHIQAQAGSGGTNRQTIIGRPKRGSK